MSRSRAARRAPTQADLAKLDDAAARLRRAAPPGGAPDRAASGRAPGKARAASPEDVQEQRRRIAGWCRTRCEAFARQWGKSAEATPPATGAGRPASVADEPGLSPRMRQTLDRLLAGDAEKQIARRLDVSPHTVHVYVKAIYRHYGASSRGELLARFVRAGARIT